MDEQFRIALLIAKQIRQELNANEETELQKWIASHPDHAAFVDKVTAEKHLLSKNEIYRLFDESKAWASLEQSLFPTKVVPLKTNRFLRYAATIALPAMLGLAYYFMVYTVPTPLVAIDEVVKPGVQQATLLLSDGETILLKQAEMTRTVAKGKAQIVNRNNRLTYQSADSAIRSTTIVYNELKTPRGGSYAVTLADDTQVWLNAGSTLKYPVAFTDSVRQIYLTGEAYFEVAHNGKPFIVSSEGMDVEVLGTSFNISAYSDESELTTTLVEGSIRLSTTTHNEILVPDRQAVITSESNEMTVQTVKSARYTSWVDGKIEFSQAPMDEVMKRLARWYDFTYAFESDAAKQFHFSARIDNTQKLSSILEMLQKTTDVKIELDENKIVIK